MVGVAVSATSHRLSLCMHYACNNKATKQSEQRREGDNDQTRPTKKNQRKNPKTRKESRRGWVRIRDMKHPRIHTPPQTRPSARSSWPLPGKSGPFYSCFAMLRLHFCKCIPYFDIALLQVHLTLPGIVAANELQHFCMALWPVWSSQTPIP